MNEHYLNMYRHDFESFIGLSFRELNPDKAFHNNWHFGVLAEALHKVGEGKTNRLILNMPPRMGKSHCVSVAWIGWLLGRYPNKKILCLHGWTTLGRDLHESCFQLMDSPRFRRIFPHARIRVDKNRLITPYGGQRLFLPFDSRLTGLGADIIILDDVMSPMEAIDTTERERLCQHFDQNILQRLNSKKDGGIVVVMQRLHEHDLTSHILAKKEGWTVISLPAIAMADECWNLPHGRIHMRRKGEVLHEAREPLAGLQRLPYEIGGHAFAYQFMQGQYVPEFGIHGEGCIYTTPYREGEFWDSRIMGQVGSGFFPYTEADFIMPRVFGVGSDPVPSNMRISLTDEEWELLPKDRSDPFNQMVIREMDEFW